MKNRVRKLHIDVKFQGKRGTKRSKWQLVDLRDFSSESFKEMAAFVTWEKFIPEMNKKVLQIHPSDNVLVALTSLAKGENIGFDKESFELIDAIPAKHKFFIENREAGDDVRMYGVLVGKAQTFIQRGALMTTENVKHASGSFAYRGVHYQWKPPDVTKFRTRTFNGYYRSDGRVGTANY